jgi:pilus assembly protein Flp/PilA
MLHYMKKFLSDDRGATALEYGLIASLVAVAIIAGVRTLGKNLNNTFNTVSSAIASSGTTTTTKR